MLSIEDRGSLANLLLEGKEQAQLFPTVDMSSCGQELIGEAEEDCQIT